MKVSRKLLVIAVAGALVAAAVPALALENEFHGLFRLNYINSNFNRSTTTLIPVEDGYYHPADLPKDAPTANLFEQRARLMYIAKLSDNYKFVAQFELDYAYWGNSSYTVGRNQGGAIGADTVNFETKNLYLDINIPSTPVNLKLGMMPYTDSYKGTIFDADMAGVLASTTLDKWGLSLGYFRFDDTAGGTEVPGKDVRDMLSMDVKYTFNKEFRLGGTYYYFMDQRDYEISQAVPAEYTTQNIPGVGDVLVQVSPAIAAVNGRRDFSYSVLGLNGEAVFGPVTVDGFVMYQFGNLDRTNVKQNLSAFAANLGSRIKAGPGTARAEFMYSSGSSRPDTDSTNHAFQVVQGESWYGNNEMVLLTRDKYAMTTDNAFFYDIVNRQQGMIMGSIGYELPLTSKLTTNANLGFAGVATRLADRSDQNLGSKVSSSQFLGTEFNAELNYKLNDSIFVATRGGIVFLGDYYKNVAQGGATPDNPYDFKILLSMSF
jgi:hypothetical protein